MSNPTISVIMSVYNTEKEFLKEAIDSILNQTFKDFEFIIINDFSNQETTNYLSTFKDNRIIIINNPTNLGLTKSLNIALKQARGKYIARMDSDDVSLPTRLEKQYSFMENHPEYAVIGCNFEEYYSHKVRKVNFSDNQEIMRTRMLFYNQGIAHPTTFFRKSFLDDNKITYDENIKKAQDYAMWVNILNNQGKIGKLDEVLFKYRIHPNQITSSSFNNQMFYEQMTMNNQLAKLNIQLTPNELNAYYHLFRGDHKESFKTIKSLITKLINANNSTNIYNNKILKKEIKRVVLLGGIKQLLRQKHFSQIIYAISLLIS